MFILLKEISLLAHKTSDEGGAFKVFFHNPDLSAIRTFPTKTRSIESESMEITLMSYILTLEILQHSGITSFVVHN
jgi:hypothetical protein